MKFPRELRDKVYRELLVPREGPIPGKETPNPGKEGSRYTLEPAILRTSKQIHLETYRVLYEENIWIRFTMDAALLKQFDLPAGRCHIFTTNLESFPGPIALNVTMKPTTDTPYDVRLAENILHLSDLSLFVYVMCMQFPEDLSGYHLCLHIDDTFHKHNVDEEELLDEFRDMQGIGEASITGTASLSTGQELAMLMMKPGLNIDEKLDRIRRFRKRADDKAAVMQIKEAERIYCRGIMSVMLVVRRDDAPLTQWTDLLRLSYRRLSFYFDVVVCNTKMGRLDERGNRHLTNILRDLAWFRSCWEVLSRS